MLPAIWHRGKLKLPANWKPAIADGPVIVAVATAYLLKLLVKDFGSKLADPNKTTHEPVFYWQYMEQINEQKEMLVAVGLLMYALYRIKALRQVSRMNNAN